MEELAQKHPTSGAGATGSAAGQEGKRSGAGRVSPSRLLWLTAVLAVLAAAAWFYDQLLTDRVVAQRQAIEALLGLPAAAGVFLIPLAILLSFRNWRRLAIGFVVPLVLSGLTTQAIKWVVGRARPDEHVGSTAFYPSKALSMGEYQSFPSGDATTAITLALLLGMYFPRARWIFYMYAGFVGLGRIVLARHFTSDVLAGYMVGAATVYICVRLLGPTFYDRDWSRTPLAR